MNYDEFKRLWLRVLGESGLPIVGVDLLDEVLDLRSTERTCKSFVEPPQRKHPEPFHASAALAFGWDALLAARTRSNEQDVLEWLLGSDRRNARTERPWLRVDVTLRASTVWGREIPLPPRDAWTRWAREITLRLERIDPIVPDERVREGRRGLLHEILAWHVDGSEFPS